MLEMLAGVSHKDNRKLPRGGRSLAHCALAVARVVHAAHPRNPSIPFSLRLRSSQGAHGATPAAWVACAMASPRPKAGPVYQGKGMEKRGSAAACGAGESSSFRNISPPNKKRKGPATLPVVCLAPFPPFSNAQTLENRIRQKEASFKYLPANLPAWPRYHICVIFPERPVPAHPMRAVLCYRWRMLHGGRWSGGARLGAFQSTAHARRFILGLFILRLWL